MCWKSTSPMEEKLKFIRAWQSNQYSITALCEAHGISRTTGHRLINRFLEEGENCFYLQSKAPKNNPNKTDPKIENAIVKLRQKHKSWGARKFKVLLHLQFHPSKIPSETTINAILSRNGLVNKRKKRPHKIQRTNPKFDPKKCNEIWSADYKGKFRLGNKRYCYPLTITDKKSRYLFTSKGHYCPNYESVKREYIRVFREFGLPYYLHTDNGSPFGSVNSICRYSKLSYWLIDNGVLPVFSDPGCPQQNGRHERMHRDLKAYCTKPVKFTLTKQQRFMDAFVKEYNEVRPHEALQMKTPDKVHVYSKRVYSERKIDYDYPYDFKVLKVTKSGSIRWGGYHWVFISGSAKRRYVGLEEIGNGIWKVFYRTVFLGYFDEKKIYKREQHLKLSKSIV